MQAQTHQVWNLRIANQIFDSMADGVFTMDTQGRISFWNKSMERISGYTAKEALGQSCQLLQCSRCFGKMCPSDINKCKIVAHGGAEAKECSLRQHESKNLHTINERSCGSLEPFRIIIRS